MSTGPQESPGQNDALARLRHSLVRPSRGQAAVGALLALLGFATVTQVVQARADDTYANMRPPELIQVLNGLNAESRRAERELNDLERTRDSLRDTSQRRQTALTQAKDELVSLGILAGTLPATGPGIRITVTVSDNGLGINQLLDGIEELRDAGAEAMELNDTVRVVAQTSFEFGPDGIEVDGTTLRPPYVIDAIGDSDTLATALGIPGGFKEDVRSANGKVSVEKLPNIDVSVVRSPVQPRFAIPVQGE